MDKTDGIQVRRQFFPPASANPRKTTFCSCCRDYFFSLPEGLKLSEALFIQYRLPVGGGPIVKNVPQVRFAATAMDFGSLVTQMKVAFVRYRVFFKRVEKARPASTGFEFRVAGE